MDSIIFTCSLVLSLFCLSFVGATPWCYSSPSCGPSTWQCKGQRQSPININQDETFVSRVLTDFTFTAYDDNTKLTMIENVGTNVKIEIDQSIKLSGGGLHGSYTGYHLHFHWGSGSSSFGSEHTFNGNQFAAELHIVHVKEGLTFDAAKDDFEGIAVLAFFIMVSPENNPAWAALAELIGNVSTEGTKKPVRVSFTLNDLISHVDLTKYYRYMGSLTTPDCAEAVVWTVFEEPISVNGATLDKFAMTVYSNSTTGEKMRNNFRPVQSLNSRIVIATTGAISSGIMERSSGNRIRQQRTTLTALTVLTPILIYFTL
ncbi:carbonic anhydrase 4-like [Latimeria chalumnae]|uniref:carbonic anhydrase n=1 Tax=Latimeria chalumnae TaxID=7897 RepID=M3XJL0_LATCH|nr:PREDICTED: carbonic anhydrase 4-like [Latimeria chalumnae]XP_014346824.1 PREDICTED: carbonic anhydrase 4-like [Latimeria chalumnae]|eukprot:XP_014346823.1 PREDICTED: carbonic anhydrase 4-like [Latimeria chalumnae]